MKTCLCPECEKPATEYYRMSDGAAKTRFHIKCWAIYTLREGLYWFERKAKGRIY